MDSRSAGQTKHPGCLSLALCGGHCKHLPEITEHVKELVDGRAVASLDGALGEGAL